MIMSDHHDHPLPPLEPDHLEPVGIIFWGIISFLSVLAVVAGLYDYFWMVREGADHTHSSHYADTKLRKAQAAEAHDKLEEYQPLLAVVNGTRVEGYYVSVDAAKSALAQGSIEDVNARQIVTTDEVKRTRLPIERAMQLVAAERARPMTKPEPLVKKVEDPAAAAEAEAAAMAETPLEANPELIAQGKALFHNPAKMCATCHSIDGSKRVGPTMKGAWGRIEELEDGKKVRVNRDYFIRSIKNPNGEVVKGYAPAMPPMLAQMLTDAEIEALMHYVASLK
jgi:mono/diheme cytochrome c family protein